MNDNNDPRHEEVLQEFPPIWKYRIRIVKNKERGTVSLDVREYATGPGFEGFTRRGIRLSATTQLKLLRDALTDVIEGGKLGP